MNCCVFCVNLLTLMIQIGFAYRGLHYRFFPRPGMRPALPGPRLSPRSRGSNDPGFDPGPANRSRGERKTTNRSSYEAAESCGSLQQTSNLLQSPGWISSFSHREILRDERCGSSRGRFNRRGTAQSVNHEPNESTEIGFFSVPRTRPARNNPLHLNWIRVSRKKRW